jgi:hypothetical protein
MSITRLTTNGLSGTKYDTVSADNYYMEPIATNLVGTATSTITFSNIPQNYKHLQIRGIGRTDRANSGGGDYAIIRFNADSGSNYAYHELYGNGASAGTQAGVSQTYGFFERMADAGATSGMFGAVIIDILDYGNVYKFKTVRNLGGYDNNSTGGSVMLGSSLWMNTAAITSITLAPGIGTNFATNSRFSLYGIRG